MNLDEDLVRSGLRLRDVLQHPRGVFLTHNGGFHRCHSELLPTSSLTDATAWGLSTLTKAKRSTAVLAGLPPIREHDIRHGTASLARLGGADMKAIQGMLRHSSLSITSDTYTSLFNDEGHRCWLASRLPVTLRYQLKTAVFPPSIETAISGPDAVPGGWQEPVRAHVLSELRLLDPTPFPDATPNATPDSSAKPDEKAPEKPSGTGGEKPLRKPTKAQARKMSGADLVPYIEALLGTDSAPSKSKVMDYFSVGAPKAQEALDALASPRPEAAVITLKASQAKTPASRQAQARTPKRAAARG